jgi:glutamine phosphoribosylpyrophosphate amidotransferase
MCAIIGFVSKNPNDKALTTLKRLFIESKIRGMHAYGYAATQGKYLYSNKGNLLKPVLDSIKQPNALIGHCRYSTSGDYKDMNNNQPIRYEEEWMVFNGVIDMRTKAEMEQAYKITMNCDNDGEIMLQNNNRTDLLKKEISFAGIFLSGNTIRLMRNKNRPAYIGFKHDSVYIGSTKDIMQRALISEIEEAVPYKEYAWTV